MYSVNISEKKFEIEFDSQNAKKGTVNGKDFTLDSVKIKEGSYHVIYNNQSYNIEILEINTDNSTVKLNINGVNYTSKVNSELDILLQKLGMDNLTSKKVKELKSPMPGLVLDIMVEPGQEVSEGDNLLILEAMKMENNIKSPVSGKIAEIKCNKGTAVEKNEILIVFE
jgi:biotin carboxyl carrier protein